MTTVVPDEITHKIANAGTIYWAGRNEGVAEELTLKSNEITRKPADYLEGTYAVHGIEEVMNAKDVLLWVDPYAESEQKFADVLVKGVGMTIVAIASRPTQFPTILIPDAGDLNPSCRWLRDGTFSWMWEFNWVSTSANSVPGGSGQFVDFGCGMCADRAGSGQPCSSGQRTDCLSSAIPYAKVSSSPMPSSRKSPQ